MKMTKDAADIIAVVHNVLMEVRAAGLDSMKIVDSVRALGQVLSNVEFIEEDATAGDCDEPDAVSEET